MVMKRMWHQATVGMLILMALIGLGVLAAVASHRMRFDGLRDELLRRFDDASRRGRPFAAMWEKTLADREASRTELRAPVAI